VVELGEHAADFAVHALGEDEFDPGGLSLLADDADGFGLGLAFGEPDALGELSELLGLGPAGDEDLVGFGDAVAGVREALGEFTVVGEEDEAGGGFVEPSDRIDALGPVGDEVDDARAAGGVGVGGDDALGLVDGVVDEAFGGDRFAIDFDARGAGIDLGSELADDGAIDGDAALEDELFAGAAGSESGVGEELVKAFLGRCDGFVWSDIGHGRLLAGWRTAGRSGHGAAGAFGSRS
jgi:hypothetical protein